MCAALKVSEVEFLINKIQRLALKCGSLIVLPLSLQEGQTYSCLLGLVLLWLSSGFESDLDATKTHLWFLSLPRSNSNNRPWELCQTFWHPLKHLIIEFHWLARRKVGSEGQAWNSYSSFSPKRYIRRGFKKLFLILYFLKWASETFGNLSSSHFMLRSVYDKNRGSHHNLHNEKLIFPFPWLVWQFCFLPF